MARHYILNWIPIHTVINLIQSGKCHGSKVTSFAGPQCFTAPSNRCAINSITFTGDVLGIIKEVFPLVIFSQESRLNFLLPFCPCLGSDLSQEELNDSLFFATKTEICLCRVSCEIRGVLG